MKMFLSLFYIMIVLFLSACVEKSKGITVVHEDSTTIEWCQNHIVDNGDGSLTYEMSSSEYDKCKRLVKKEEKAVIDNMTNSVVQIATLVTRKQQLIAIDQVMDDNNKTTYVYDSEAIGNGTVKSFSPHDHWNAVSYYDIQKVKRQIEAGFYTWEQVPVDCDDSQIHMYIALLKMGYPADQLSWNFDLVPPSAMSGIIDGYDGHAVLYALVEGETPYALEDIHYPRKVSLVEGGKGYYCVGFLEMHNVVTSDWDFVDSEGYEMISNKEISIYDAKQRPAYKKHTEWTNTIFRRGDFD